MITDIEKAYIAGFFDGEGSVSFLWPKSHGRKTSGRLSVRITQNDRRPLDWIRSLYGGSVCERRRTERRQLQHDLTLTTELARKFLADIKPYLRVKANTVEEKLALDRQYVKRRAGE